MLFRSSMLKDYLGSSVKRFTTLMRKIHNVTRIQILQVRGELERDHTYVLLQIHQMTEPLRTVFSLLHMKVSNSFFGHLFDHVMSIYSGDGKYRPICDDQWWKTARGIPFPHQVKECIDQCKSIQLSMIHPFWKKLSWEDIPISEPEDDLDDDDHGL